MFSNNFPIFSQAYFPHPGYFPNIQEESDASDDSESDEPEVPVTPPSSRGGSRSATGARGGRRASTASTSTPSAKRQRSDASNADDEFEQARRASLRDAKSTENKKNLDSTMALICSETEYSDAVIDLKEDCLVCMEALYKREPGEPWQGACRAQCEGCGGSGPMVHAKCALKIESKCPVCRKPAAALFAMERSE